MKEGSKREEVEEEEKKKRRGEKKLILDKSSREDEATFLHPPSSCRHPDSARLPKLCLDLNRSRLEKYLLCPADSPEIFHRTRGIFLEGYIDSLLRRLFLLVRLASEYHCRNCIANQYKVFIR